MSTHRRGSIDKVSVIKVSADDTERVMAVTIKHVVPGDEKNDPQMALAAEWQRWPIFEINNRFLPSRRFAAETKAIIRPVND